MANADQIRVLNQKRGTIKGQITSFMTFIDKYKNGEEDPLKLNLRLQKLKSTFETFDDIQDQLELVDEDNNPDQIRYDIQEQYFEALTIGEQLLLDAQRVRNPTEGLNRDDNNASRTSIAPAQQTRRIKLPEASLPTFDGRYEEWLSFKDAFTSMIHNQPDLNNVEKLQYLKSTLKGEAARKIQVFSITAENYARAWDLLQRTYQDQRILISKHLSLLLRLPVQEKETSEGLIKLADETQQHLLSLKTLGVDVNDEIIVQNLEEKLHKSTADKWDETLDRGVFPKLDDMLEFLYRTAARVSKREGYKTCSSSSNSQGQQTKSNAQSGKGKNGQSKRNTFVTSTSAVCPICRDKQHPLYRCETFRSFPVTKRIKAVKDAAICGICFRSNHEQKDCKSGNCMICNERHNTLLHLHKNQEASTSQS